MRVAELIDAIAERFPRFNRAWEGDYRKALAEHEGPDLQDAWETTILGWRRSSPPRPADIRENLPSHQRETIRTPKIDGWDWTQKIMSGDWGKDAVRRGVASDLDIWLQRNPGEYPDAMLLEKFERDKARSADLMREERNRIRSLPELYDAMQRREQMLARKYGEP